MSTARFSCDYAKRVAGCKKCKMQIQKGELRLAKITPNYFIQNADGPPPDMKQYFHPNCLFETFYKARATTKVIDEQGDIEDWDKLTDEDKETLSKLIEDLAAQRAEKGGGAAKTPKAKRAAETPKVAKAGSDDDGEPTPKRSKKDEEPKKAEKSEEKKKKKEEEPKNKKEKEDVKKKKEKEEAKKEEEPKEFNEASKFNQFIKFSKMCEVIGSLSKHSEKAEVVRQFLNKKGYDGDTLTLLRLLLPGIDQRVYNMKGKQILKHIAEIYDLEVEELINEYKANGDVSAVVRETMEKKGFIKTEDSKWSIQKVDRWLNKLTEMTSDHDQVYHLKFVAKRMSGLEMMYLIRLVMKDLRINAGTKHILDGLHSSAYEAFQSCRDLKEIIHRCRDGTLEKKAVEVGIKLGTPVLPMLAEACKSVEQAMSRCGNGMFAEIKYDGERVQVHKKGDEFSFFSRSLKPVQAHKVAPFKEFIPQAFSNGSDLILDAEVLMVDTNTGKPLPFGTLGVHKKEKFKNACVCLYVFDILRYNDDDLTDKPLSERKKLLEKNMKEVQNHVMFSNYFEIDHGDNAKLQTMIWKAIDEGLEGLVMKDKQSKYEPGKRHWLKVKKDYLEEGKMADTADLLVLGSYFGTGNKGGMMSVFLMGVRDPATNSYRTVTKCGNGFTDDHLDQINKALSKHMKRIDRAFDSLPSWLTCSRSLVPDFVITDPKEAPVWEITGAEFSKSDNHTANGISIRFPRMTKVRDDKHWESATNLEELQKLFDTSKMKADIEETKEDEIPLYAKNLDGNEKTDAGDEKTEKEEEGDKEASSSGEDECPADKEPCKYGKECYRENPGHKEKYWHPNK